ncbi:MAG: hypothetical protein GF307_10060 [candidate division Zixibacteria bacterium]|nr:hypothetical protein [candidate division Zixibacteria bacterium]
MFNKKTRGRISFRISALIVCLFLLAVIPGCISWNVDTILKSKVHADASLEREGRIVLTQFDTDSLENRFKTEIDTAEARAYIDDNYVIPVESASLTDFELHPDSTYSARWSLETKHYDDWISDYRRLGSDSGVFSGNRVMVEKNGGFFKTSYEYKEVFYDGLQADSIIMYLPEILPKAEEAFFGQLSKRAPSRSSAAALERASDTLNVIVTQFWDDMFGHFLYDNSLDADFEEFFESRRDSVAVTIGEILEDYPGGSGFSRELIVDAIKESEDAIDDGLRERGVSIWGAYNSFSDDRYIFALELEIPGRVEATNADSIDGNRLRWNFSNQEFRAGELLLFASSSEYHWFRLVLVLIGVVLIIWLIVYIARRSAVKEQAAG